MLVGSWSTILQDRIHVKHHLLQHIGQPGLKGSGNQISDFFRNVKGFGTPDISNCRTDSCIVPAILIAKLPEEALDGLHIIDLDGFFGWIYRYRDLETSWLNGY